MAHAQKLLNEETVYGHDGSFFEDFAIINLRCRFLVGEIVGSAGIRNIIFISFYRRSRFLSPNVNASGVWIIEGTLRDERGELLARKSRESTRTLILSGTCDNFGSKGRTVWKRKPTRLLRDFCLNKEP